MKRRSIGDSRRQRDVGVGRAWVKIRMSIVKVGIIGMVGVKILVLVIVRIILLLLGV